MLPYRTEDFQILFRAGGRDDLIDDPRFATRAERIANSDSLYRDIASVLVGNTTVHWLELCRREGIPATRAATLTDLVDELPLAEHPHAGRYRQIPSAVNYSRTPTGVGRHAPLVGEHGREVLAEVGFTDDELTTLEADGVLGTRSED